MTSSMTLVTEVTDRVARGIERRTSRRSFVGRTAMVGSALAVSTSYVLRPGTAYAAICNCPYRASSSNRRSCDCGDLCCDGYTEFCCHIYGENSCPPNSVLAGWGKVDNSSFCDGAARYYMDCNRLGPACGCGSSGVCRDPNVTCQCRSCSGRADGCSVFRYGNCNNDIYCVGPIVCRVVTCSRPWEVDPSCSTTPRTDPSTRSHNRACLTGPPPVVVTAGDLAWAKAIHADYLGRQATSTEAEELGSLASAGNGRSDLSVAFSQSDVYVQSYLDSVYQEVLGRPVDEAGRVAWTNAIRAGAIPSTVAVSVYASDEHFVISGNTDTDFVRELYLKIMNRQPDANGSTYWVNLIAQTNSRQDASLAFYSSIESRPIGGLANAGSCMAPSRRCFRAIGPHDWAAA